MPISMAGPELTRIQANLQAMLKRMGPEKARAHPSYIGAAPTEPGIPTAAPGTPTPGAPAAPAAPEAPGAPATDPMAMYREALERLSGGGAMLESQLADIETGKREAIGAGQQALVSSGLAGTTMMAGVPIQAEKGAGRARLAARGQVEQLRLQTLSSYAGLAQQAKLATAERRAALQRLQTQISAQKTAATTAQKAEEKRLKTQIAAQQRAATLASIRAPSATQAPSISPTGVQQRGGGAQMVPSATRARMQSGRSGLIGMTPFDYSGFTNVVSGGTGSPAMVQSPDVQRAFPRASEPSGRGGAYTQRFPSIYGQGEEPVPQWM